MLRDCINDCLLKDSFPDRLNLGNITPVHKKDEPMDKENYRPVSDLPLLAKVFERLIYDQLNEYLEQYLNSLLCGFRKAHSIQHALFTLLQEWQNGKSVFLGLYQGIYLKPTTACHMTLSLQNLKLITSVSQD